MVLLKLGFQVEHHVGGRAFLSSLDQRRPDLAVLGYYTADLTAPFVLKLGGLSSANADFPLVLARPPSMAGMPVSKEEQGLFRSVIGFPIAREALVKRLRPHLPARV
ncbi:MAG: hypothetical protein K2Q10_03995 [Rhodospirillales bacterium]|nr:hypothetical protein [Rhodospirillales bacterium]